MYSDPAMGADHPAKEVKTLPESNSTVTQGIYTGHSQTHAPKEDPVAPDFTTSPTGSLFDPSRVERYTPGLLRSSLEKNGPANKTSLQPVSERATSYYTKSSGVEGSHLRKLDGKSRETGLMSVQTPAFTDFDHGRLPEFKTQGSPNYYISSESIQTDHVSIPRSWPPPSAETAPRSFTRASWNENYVSFNETSPFSEAIAEFIGDLPLLGYGVPRGNEVQQALEQFDHAFPNGYQM